MGITRVLRSMRAKKAERSSKLLEGMRSWNTMQDVKDHAEATKGEDYRKMVDDDTYKKINGFIGMITNGELEMNPEMLMSLMETLGDRMTVEEAERMVQELDTDGDGTVSEEEFIRWYSHPEQGDKPNPAQLVEKFF